MFCCFFKLIFIFIHVYSFSVNNENTFNKWCPIVTKSESDINTVEKFQEINIQPSLNPLTRFWNETFENKYRQFIQSNKRPPLKVFVVPHSHNEAGWKQTFEEYYNSKTKRIIENIIYKLDKLPLMTFIWNEMSFLAEWWETATDEKKNILKDLIKQGRLEITTGGWVMPDEACTHIYSLLDQFIEGHEWLKTHLGISPNSGWSIDAFGHGPTVPYILEHSGLKGTVIQRIHYLWKKWLADQTLSDFYWATGWSTKPNSLLVHNMPLENYSIKGSCGPHQDICRNFDFRHITEDLTEHSVNTLNLENKANTLINQYRRLGSLTTHNVVLVPLGDDFRYEDNSEFDSQHQNYMKLFNFINSNKTIFNAQVQFGTLKNYFDEVKKIYKKEIKSFPIVKGDFFPYVGSSGKGGVWSGYFTTRPYMKILARQLEHQLRTSEILFTLGFNTINCTRKAILKTVYNDLVTSRRNLGLFQNHNGITGTSTKLVMKDYGTRLLNSLNQCLKIQELTLHIAMINESVKTEPDLESNLEWKIYGEALQRRILNISKTDETKIIVSNPLTVERVTIVQIKIDTSDVAVYDHHKQEIVPHQIGPIIELIQKEQVISNDTFELVFVTTLPALAAVTFSLTQKYNPKAICKVFCTKCDNIKSGKFELKPLSSGNIHLQNSILKITIDKDTRFLKKVIRKDTLTEHKIQISFGAYESYPFESGAYLFKPNPHNPEKPILKNNNEFAESSIIVSGLISTMMTTMHLPLLAHRITIFNVKDQSLSRGIFIENVVDFGIPPNNRDTELYMRLSTDIGHSGSNPEFYTDQNGFQYQKRVRLKDMAVEAQYYPITTMAWIQDKLTRMTYITNHAQGASSFVPGRLEVMLDRRTMMDDERGLGEEVVDNKATTFHNWLLFDIMQPASKNNTEYELPSRTANVLSQSLNYPATVYYVNKKRTKQVLPYFMFVEKFPKDLHLLTLRTVSDGQLPSSSCYMVLQRPGFSCRAGDAVTTNLNVDFNAQTKFNTVQIKNITAVSLTGLEDYTGVSGFEDIHLDPMELKTYRLNFTINPFCK